MEWSTDDVIDWLLYKNTDFYRLNINDADKLVLHLDLGNGKEELTISIKEKENSINSADIKNVWFRRMRNSYTVDVSRIKDKKVKSTIFKNSKKEGSYFIESIFHLLKNKNWLNFYKTVDNDKIETLLIAKKCGLDIPETILTTTKNGLLDFSKKNQR